MAKENKIKGSAEREVKKDAQQPIQGEEKLALGKWNFVLIGLSLLLIVIGFALMSGSANVGTEWNENLFEARRTTVGPMMSLAGFLLMFPAILWRKK